MAEDSKDTKETAKSPLTVALTANTTPEAEGESQVISERAERVRQRTAFGKGFPSGR